MGIEKTVKTSEVKEISRCCKIVINAPYGQVQSITQEYEDVMVADGVKLSGKQSIVYEYSVLELLNVKIDVNGKELTGAEVMQFFLVFNDNREALLAAAAEVPQP